MPPIRFRAVGVAGFLAVLGLVMPARTDTPKGKSYALLVGVKDYGDRASLANLKYTENDVEELAIILDKPNSPFHKNVRILTSTRGKKDKNDLPTAANIRKALAALVKEKGKNDSILVALSGHGIQLTVRGPKAKDKEKSYAYFCPQDADLSGADYETGRHDKLVLLSDLLGDLGDCGAGTKLLLMDACRNERSSARSLRLNKELVPDGVAALFSCATGEQAFETDSFEKDKRGKGHGVFFHHVIAALKGGAKDKNGQITWSGLVDHVTENVIKDVPRLIGGGAKQTPHEIKNFAGASPVLLTGLQKEVSTPAKDKVAREKPESSLDEKAFVTKVCREVILAARPIIVKPVEPWKKVRKTKEEFFTLKSYEVNKGNTEVKVVMAYGGSGLGFRGATASITLTVDTTDKAKWKLRAIEYDDDLPKAGTIDKSGFKALMDEFNR